MDLGFNDASLTFTLKSASLYTLVLFSPAVVVRLALSIRHITSCQHAETRGGPTNSSETEPWNNGDWPPAGPLLTPESTTVSTEWCVPTETHTHTHTYTGKHTHNTYKKKKAKMKLDTVESASLVHELN